MRIVAIIQARMGSKRLPGKVMMPLAGAPMLQRIIERVKRAKTVNEIIVADSGMNEDEPIYNMAKNFGVGRFSARRWHKSMFIKPEDLIWRYFIAASDIDADIIVRICADNPFIEPAEIDRAVQFYLEKPRIFVTNMMDYDYFKYSNLEFRDKKGKLIAEIQHPMGSGYPDGIGCEVFSMSTLTWMQEYIKKPNLREHPHQYFHENGLVESPKCPSEFAFPDLKLDVNTEDDYKFVKDIYDNLYPKNKDFHITDVIEYLDKKK